MSGSFITRLPPEVHSSAHRVLYDSSLVGEFELRIYRGTSGPVLILEEASSSPMPMEYLSEWAVTRFLDQVPNSLARFFERHVVGSHEVWVEVGFDSGMFFRRPCHVNDLAEAIAMGEAESGPSSTPGRIQEPFAAHRRR